jgi:hypothetical protein
VRCSRLVRGNALDEFRRGIEQPEHLRVLVVDLPKSSNLMRRSGTLLLVRRWARMNCVR